MALITSISGVPLYSSIQEALNWAAARGLNGYHTHTFQGKLGYMGGATHSEVSVVVARRSTPTQQAVARRVIPQVNIPQQQVVQQQQVQRQITPQPIVQPVQPVQPVQQPTPIPTPTPPTYSGGGSSGGGGY
jgi:hypothetical protein|tara:strand:+ start:33 stop:428 length:396 start_codon:yes stop_codon:yes gene_type:complete